MRLMIRQPLLWFLVVSACLFLADALIPEPRDQILVSNAQRDRLALLWKTQTGENASAQELDSLVNNWIEEEVLFREALRLGLDQDDSIVRRRLVQKLGFIAEADTSAEPEIGELESFYAENISEYTLPIRYSLRQLYFTDVDDALSQLAQSQQGIDISSTGESSMLNSSYAFRSALDIDATFGSGFSTKINSMSVNLWQGPVESSFGYHLIFITSIHETEAAPFASIVDRVLSDYQQVQKVSARQNYVNSLMSDYEIRID